MAAPVEVRIVLLGKNGSGKSSTGNVILGEEKFEVSCDPDVASQDCQTEEGNLNGRKILVTDTPGICDTERPEEDLKYSIISCLTECAPGPHAFVLVLRVGRYTKEEKQSMKIILEWFGEDALKHTVILFTHGEDLDKNQTIKTFVERNKDLKELVEKCGGRVHVIDSKQWNRKDDINAQSADPLKEINKMMMQKRLAGELVDVQALEELKNQLSSHKPSTHQELSQGSGSEYRSNSFQVKQLLGTIDTMVRDNDGGHYTNKSLQEMAEVIKNEVKKIKEGMEERGEKLEESEIWKRARERVRPKNLRSLGAAKFVALLGALLGFATRRMPFVLITGLLAAVGVELYKYFTCQE